MREPGGFERVRLAPGEKKRVRFSLGPEELRFWGPAEMTWVVEPGKFDRSVGGDSSATPHAEFEVLRQGSAAGK